jgi:hypothetical protein
MEKVCTAINEFDRLTGRSLPEKATQPHWQGAGIVHCFDEFEELRATISAHDNGREAREKDV